MIGTSFLSTILNKAPVYGIWDASGSTLQQILEFDSITETGLEATSTITEYPIENGTKVTDYKYDNPDIIEMVGVISKTNSSMAGLSGLIPKGRDEQINKVRQSLKKYKSGIYRLVVQTKSGRYDWFTLKDYRIPETRNNYGVFEVEMTFKEIIRPVKSENPANASYSATKMTGMSLKTGL